MRHFFVSHDQAETFLALKLYGDLRNKGVQIWLGIVDDHIMQRIPSECVGIIALVSTEYLESAEGKTHLSQADLPVYCVLLDKDSKTAGIDFSGWHQADLYSAAFEKLLQRLRLFHPNEVTSEVDKETQYLVRKIVTIEQRFFSEITVRKNGTPVVGSLAYISAEDSSLPIENFDEHWVNRSFNLIVGHRGSGKSTLLHQIVLLQARARLMSKSNRLPFYVDLETWEDESNIWDLVRAFWRMDGDPEQMIGELVLCLDNLDCLSRERIDQLLEWGTKLESQARVLLTSYNRLSIDFPYPRINLEITETDVKHVVTTLLSADAEHFLKITGSERPYIYREVIHDLNFLFILVGIFDPNSTDPLPSDQSNLYAVLSMIFWTRYRGLSGWIAFEEAEPSLAKLAFSIQKDEHDITPVEIESNVTLQLASKMGILSPYMGKVQFRYPFMKYFFVATQMFDEDIDTILDEPEFSGIGGRIPTKWDDAVITMAGLAEKPEEFIFAIAAIDPFLAARCLKSGVSVPSQFKVLLVNLFVQMLNDDATPIRIAAAHGLADIKEPSSIVHLMEALQITHTNPKVSIGDIFKEMFDADIESTGISEIPELADVINRKSAFDDFEIMGVIDAIAEFGDPAIPHLFAIAKNNDLSSQAHFTALMKILQFNNKTVIPELLGLMRSKHAYGQMIATGLARFGNEARPGLLEALRHSDPEVRHYAMWGLIEIVDQTCIPDLIRALDDNSENVRMGAAVGLSRIGVATLPSLFSKLNVTLDANVSIITQALSHIGEPAIAGLVEELDTHSHLRRMHIAKALADIGNPAIEILFAKLLNGTSDIRLGAAWALGLMGETTRSRLLQLMDEGNEEIRRAILSAITHPGVEDNSVYIKALTDENINVRMQTLYSISHLDPQVTIPVYVIALRDDEFEVRRRAVQSLVDLGDEVIPSVIPVLQGENEQASFAAAKVLGALGEVAKPYLLKLENDERNLTGLMVKVALGEIEGDLPQRLIASIESGSSDKKTKLYAASLLGQVAEKMDYPLIVRLFESFDWEIRMIAVQFLAEMFSTSELMNIIATSSTDIDSQVVSLLAVTLQDVQDSKGIEFPIRYLSSSEVRLRLSTLIALESVGDRTFATEVQSALKDQNYFIRSIAKDFLKFINLYESIDIEETVLHPDSLF